MIASNPDFQPRRDAIDACKHEARLRADAPGRSHHATALFSPGDWRFIIGLACGLVIASLTIVAHSALFR